MSEEKAMILCGSSKHLLSLVESFEHEGETYIVTKFAKGGNLLSYLTGKGVSLVEESTAKHIVQ